MTVIVTSTPVSGLISLHTQKGSACYPPACSNVPPRPCVVLAMAAVVAGAALNNISHSGRTSPASLTSSAGAGPLGSTAALITSAA